MTRYRVIARAAQFGPGTVLELSPQQAAARAHRLRAAGPDQFEPTAPVEFKAGEEIGIVSGEVAKADLDAIEPTTIEPATGPAAGRRGAARGAAA